MLHHQHLYRHVLTHKRRDTKSSSIAKGLILVMLLFALTTSLISSQEAVHSPNHAPALEVVKEYFDSLTTEGVDTVIDHYGEEFYAHTDRDEWNRSLRNKMTRTGRFVSKELQSVSARLTTGTPAIGWIYELAYRIEYSRRVGIERFIVAEYESGIYAIGGHLVELQPVVTQN